MLRQIIHIDEEKCNGCGICAAACHEGAIDIVDGKAKLVREHFCDGFGDCLPACPTGAITFERREAPAYDEQAVKRAQAEKQAGKEPAPHACPSHAGGCPGSRTMQLAPKAAPAAAGAADPAAARSGAPVSRLAQWPVQIKLLPTRAPFYDGASLLIAADCTAYAYANMHEEFMRGRITLIGCPKLDAVDYAEKLTAILRENNILSVTVVRMEVPCCGGLQMAAQRALQNSGKRIPFAVVTVTRDGCVADRALRARKGGGAGAAL